MEDIHSKNENEFSVAYFDNKAIISKNGPYGFWSIKLERGVTPKELNGSFTTVDSAIEFVKGLENTKKFLKG